MSPGAPSDIGVPAGIEEAEKVNVDDLLRRLSVEFPDWRITSVGGRWFAVLGTLVSENLSRRTLVKADNPAELFLRLDGRRRPQASEMKLAPAAAEGQRGASTRQSARSGLAGAGDAKGHGCVENGDR
ncbi:hypothetical protein [Actinomadura sp. 3N407]|uniref:hypothetical protein n=1 Tax=Actinomadura sp. 3N407 TaxID=3457423 RepID=UPI003FCE9800